MIEKRENCLYCNKKMESKTAKKKFCSASHRLNYHREVKRGTIIVSENKDAFDAPMNHDLISDEMPQWYSETEKNLVTKKGYIIPVKAEKSKVMEEMERRVVEIQKQFLNKK